MISVSEIWSGIMNKLANNKISISYFESAGDKNDALDVGRLPVFRRVLHLFSQVNAKVVLAVRRVLHMRGVAPSVSSASTETAPELHVKRMLTTWGISSHAAMPRGVTSFIES